MIAAINLAIKDNKILLGTLVFPVFFVLLYIFSILPIQAGLAIVGFLFLLILIAKIELGLYLMAFFLPIIHWDFFVWKLQIPLIDLIGVFVLTAFFIRYFMLIYLSSEKERPKIIWPFPYAFGLFFVSAFLSGFFSPTILDSLWYSVRWILFFYLAFLVFPINTIKSEKTLKNVLLSTVISASLISLFCLASLYGQDWRQEFIRIKPIAINGIFPIGENQNLIVEIVLPAIFYILALKQMVTKQRISRFLNLIFLFLTAVLIGTFSRGGWLALLICLAITILYRYRKRVRHLILPVIMMMIVLTPIFYYMYLMQTDYHIGVGSNQSRILSSQIAFNSFLDKPMLGNGSGEYMNLIADNVRFRAKFGNPLESHGIIQKVMAENGALGLIGFVMFVILIFKYMYQGLMKMRKYDLIYLYLVLAGASVFIFELFNTSYYKGKLWFPIAIALVGVNIYLEKEKYAGAEN
jgi:O-antigen ligase